MTSPARLSANRRNAEKSAGLSTPERKDKGSAGLTPPYNSEADYAKQSQSLAKAGGCDMAVGGTPRVARGGHRGPPLPPMADRQIIARLRWMRPPVLVVPRRCMTMPNKANPWQGRSRRRAKQSQWRYSGALVVCPQGHIRKRLAVSL